MDACQLPTNLPLVVQGATRGFTYGLVKWVSAWLCFDGPRASFPQICPWSPKVRPGFSLTALYSGFLRGLSLLDSWQHPTNLHVSPFFPRLWSPEVRPWA